MLSTRFLMNILVDTCVQIEVAVLAVKNYWWEQEGMMEEQDKYSSDSEEDDKTDYNYDSNNYSRNCGPRTSKHREKVRYIVHADIVRAFYIT